MTLHTVIVKHDRFIILSKNPTAWQIILSKTLNIKRKDQILIKEVDSFNNPTGNEKRGEVYYINCGVDIVFNNGLELYYICPVLIGVGDLTIDGTFIIY